MKGKLSDNQYSVDHLERVKEGNNTPWKYPDIEDTQIIFNDQIIPVKAALDRIVKQNARH